MIKIALDQTECRGILKLATVLPARDKQHFLHGDTKSIITKKFLNIFTGLNIFCAGYGQKWAQSIRL